MISEIQKMKDALTESMKKEKPAVKAEDIDQFAL